MADHDVIVLGGGPSGAVCAAVCARAGLRVAVIERAVFPREKVCGDCVNPGCWRVLDSLGLRGHILALPHAMLQRVEIGHGTRPPVVIPLDSRSSHGEMAVRRLELDHALLDRARSLGARILDGCNPGKISRTEHGWEVQCDSGPLTAAWLVAADGRNSTVCRQLGILPKSSRNRVALQTHCRLPASVRHTVGLRILPIGYCGYADIGNDQLNLCLVGRADHLPALREWAASRFPLNPNPVWRSVSPIEREDVPPASLRLLLVGDAARVVEPFTGEGIRYALESGWLAGQCLATRAHHETIAADYTNRWQRIYKGRLWVNRLARTAVKHPALASPLLAAASFAPALLRFLTSKVVSR